MVLFLLMVAPALFQCARNGISSLPSESIKLMVSDGATGLSLGNSVFVINDSLLTTSDKDGMISVSLTSGGTNLQITSFPYLPQVVPLKKLQDSNYRIEFELPAKLKDYQRLLLRSIDEGFEFYTVEEYWQKRNINIAQKYIVLRHDVDYDPVTAAALAILESNLQIKSTFYFRWSTSDKTIVKFISSMGHEIGLHFETIADYAKKHNLTLKEQVNNPQVFDECRSILKKEINDFEYFFGDISSVTSHGDKWNISNHFSNAELLRDQDLSEYFIIVCASFLENYRAFFDLFIADSGGHWTSESFDQALQNSPDRLYVLVHPDWWNDKVKYSMRKANFDYYYVNFFYEALLLKTNMK
jgi:hypothetical protein